VLADIRTHGQIVQGRPMMRWVPQHASATVKNFYADRLSVMSGTVRGVSFGELTAQGEVDAVSVQQNPNIVRIDGKIRVIDTNGRRLGIATTTGVDLVCPNATLKRRIQVENTNGVAPTQPVTLTAPASGSAYVNEDACIEQVIWSGGTLTTPFVEVSVDDGVTWNAVWFENGGGSITLQPGDQIRWTYSSAPTIRKILRK
jgi:hypothetical protein